MSGKLLSSVRAVQTALFLAAIASQIAYIDAKKFNSTSTESFLEYHFHTYFDQNDPVQVAQAIELRNEIIANCVLKKIIAIPLYYHYDPQNPVLERKSSTFFNRFFINVILTVVCCFVFYGEFRSQRYDRIEYGTGRSTSRGIL